MITDVKVKAHDDSQIRWWSSEEVRGGMTVLRKSACERQPNKQTTWNQEKFRRKRSHERGMGEKKKP